MNFLLFQIQNYRFANLSCFTQIIGVKIELSQNSTRTTYSGQWTLGGCGLDSWTLKLTNVY